MKNSIKKPIEDYKAVILDMDGTLYFQFPLRVCMVFSLAVYYAIHFYRVKELLLIKKFRQLREAGRLDESEGLADDNTKKTLTFWIYEYPLKFVRLFRDKKLVTLMNDLKQKGTKIIVYSDYQPKDKIKAVGLTVDDYFCSSDADINCMKPNPRGLEYIISIIGIETQDILFIGDRHEKDGLCAEAMQMDYIILSKFLIARIVTRYNGLDSYKEK